MNRCYSYFSLVLCKLLFLRCLSENTDISFRVETQLSLALQAHPVLNQLTLKLQTPCSTGYTAFIHPLWFSKPHVKEISLLYVSSLVGGLISLPSLYILPPPSFSQPTSIFLTFLTFQMALLLYIYLWSLLCPSLDHSPVY